jgi:hypothetical protein
LRAGKNCVRSLEKRVHQRELPCGQRRRDTLAPKRAAVDMIASGFARLGVRHITDSKRERGKKKGMHGRILRMRRRAEPRECPETVVPPIRS